MGKTSQFLSPGKRTQLLCLILMATSSILWGGIPSGYYDAAEGKSGSTLKSALNDIIDGHTEFPYTSTGTDVWDILKVSDRDPNNASNVICIYTQYSIDAAQEYNDGNGWSREHVWAKSHGDFGTTTGTGTDLHNLKPEDVSVNSTRNNKDFDDGGTIVTDSSPPAGYDGTLDCYTTTYTWEPPDGVKGDVARIIFYMVTRYEGENGEVDLEMVDYADSAPNLEPLHGVQSTLYAWHVADPVDSFEQNRNEVIYGYQGNRNPFIDHPEYVESIWNEALPAPTNLSANSILETSLNLNWADNAVDETGYYIYRNDSKIATLSANSTSNSVTGLIRGTTYNFKVSAYRSTTESTKTSLDVTTNGSGNLIITGVYDGPLTGGLPKGIELYAIDNIADLSSYGLGSATNGGGTDGEEFTFPADAATAGDFIYVASEATGFTTWFGTAPDYTSGSMGVNGDDAVELFYNSSVIDVYGDINTLGTGQPWEYLDGWAYSLDNRSASSTFNSSHWTFSGPNVWDDDGSNTNATATPPFPVGTFNYTDGSLPVTLSLWTATSTRGTVNLSWTTDSEIENQGFIIERRRDRHAEPVEAWAQIASFAVNPDLLGQGSTSSRNDYSYMDKQVKVGKTYSYRLSDVDYRGSITRHAEIDVIVKAAGADLKPSDVKLHTAFPNPFNPDVNLSFTLENSAENLSLEIYDLQGILINTLSSGYHELGAHEFIWNGNDVKGNAVSSGVYMVRLSAGSVVQIQRVTLLR